jgi:hypothetical protein
MEPTYRQVIEKAYEAFNARQIDAVLAWMDADVHWPNGWEGGYVHGHVGVRDYWTRQWQEIDPVVTPVEFQDEPDGRVRVRVHQHVKDVEGNVLFDGTVTHVYAFDKGKIKRMEIVKE